MGVSGKLPTRSNPFGCQRVCAFLSPTHSFNEGEWFIVSSDLSCLSMCFSCYVKYLYLIFQNTLQYYAVTILFPLVHWTLKNLQTISQFRERVGRGKKREQKMKKGVSFCWIFGLWNSFLLPSLFSYHLGGLQQVWGHPGLDLQWV